MVAAAGDVNNDGFGDALVGLGLVGGREPGPSSGDPVFSPETHRVWTIYGAIEGRWRNLPMRPIPAQLIHMRLDSFGYSMTGVGDFNDDSFDDVVISGSALISASEQWSHVYLGSSTGLPERPNWAIDLRASSRESIGNPVRVIGDASGDGLVDFLLPRGTRGALTLHFFSRQSRQARSQLYPVESLVVQDGAYNFSEPFIAVLDANGDGLQDLIIANTPTSCS
jgi:hypothetical protein